MPANLASDMLLPLYNAGAKISSHSWGSKVGPTESGNRYTKNAQMVDTFMRTKPDALGAWPHALYLSSPGHFDSIEYIRYLCIFSVFSCSNYLACVFVDFVLLQFSLRQEMTALSLDPIL